jgi:hypothetical protein
MQKDLLLTPLVIAQRLPVLWMEAVGLSPGRPESGRMVAEKVAAVSEGLVAANLEMHKLWWQSVLALSQGMRPPGPISMTHRVTSAALQPAARRVRSNVRRLRKAV